MIIYNHFWKDLSNPENWNRAKDHHQQAIFVDAVFPTVQTDMRRSMQSPWAFAHLGDPYHSSPEYLGIFQSIYIYTFSF